MESKKQNKPKRQEQARRHGEAGRWLPEWGVGACKRVNGPSGANVQSQINVSWDVMYSVVTVVLKREKSKEITVKTRRKHKAERKRAGQVGRQGEHTWYQLQEPEGRGDTGREAGTVPRPEQGPGTLPQTY